MKTGIKFIAATLAISLLPSLSMAQAPLTSEPIIKQTPKKVAFLGLKRKQTRINVLKKDAARLIKRPPSTTYGETALGCIAVAVYHEARGEPVIGQKGVASVIVQRSITPERWGDTPCEVVIPVQFSFMQSRYRFEPISDMKAWKLAVRVALTVMYEGPMDELRDADHYHATYVDPKWRYKMRKTAQIGNHIFYSDPESLPVTFVSR